MKHVALLILSAFCVMGTSQTTIKCYVTTPDDVALEGVEINGELTGSNGKVILEYQSTTPREIELDVFYKDDPSRCLSLNDVKVYRAHLLGEAELTGWLETVGDIDQDKSVSSRDAMEIDNIITNDEYRGREPQWFFVDEQKNSRELIYEVEGSGEELELRLIAYKRGNVDNNYKCSLTGLKNTVIKELDVSPNPASNILEISEELTGQFDLINISGSIITVESEDGRIDVGGMPRGTYILRYRDNTGTSMARLVLQ